jgi:Fe2+ transport system protein FeoA
MHKLKLPLSIAQAGSHVRVCTVQDLDGHARRLRELGVFEGSTLRVVSNNDPLICQVGECRFGVCRRLARCVLVEPVQAEAVARSA